jgi:hypothetical protein
MDPKEKHLEFLLAAFALLLLVLYLGVFARCYPIWNFNDKNDNDNKIMKLKCSQIVLLLNACLACPCSSSRLFP